MEVAEFDVLKELRSVLSDGRKDTCIFDRLMERFESFSSRQVANLTEMRNRDNKRLKGLGWERFCQWYLHVVCGYVDVWLWHEIPQPVKDHLSLGHSKVDNGIDIVARRTIEAPFIAVQCKYRADRKGAAKYKPKVTWTTISTFVGLCAVTGPWELHLVMTNCSGVSRKVARGPRDRTMAYGTFKSLTRGQCTIADVAQVVAAETANPIPRTMEELRAARLAKFG